MERKPATTALVQRAELAAAIEEHAADIERRAVDLIGEQASGGALSDFQQSIAAYLRELAVALRMTGSVGQEGARAWTRTAREHALARARAGFDVDQLVRELTLLRRALVEVLMARGKLADVRQVDWLAELVEAAIADVVRNYVDWRDLEARRAQAEHIGFVTHELRGPLNIAMLSAAELREARSNPNADEQHALDALDRSLDELKQRVNSVLLVERAEAGELRARKTWTTLGELLDPIVESLRPQAARKNLELSTAYAPATPLEIDPELTASAVRNLVENAIRYTDAGRVSVGAVERPTEIEIHVRDQCAGLTPEELKTIFEPFKRGASRHSGTGLGLSIARKAVDAQGGEIHAESCAPAGCHFWIVLPRATK